METYLFGSVPLGAAGDRGACAKGDDADARDAPACGAGRSL